MNSTRKTARIAGALYLLSAVTAGVPLMYVPSTLIVSDNAAATANNILASEMLFRAGIFSELIGGIVLIFLVWALYRLSDYTLGLSVRNAGLRNISLGGLGQHPYAIRAHQVRVRNFCTESDLLKP